MNGSSLLLSLCKRQAERKKTLYVFWFKFQKKVKKKTNRHERNTSYTYGAQKDTCVSNECHRETYDNIIKRIYRALEAEIKTD